MQPNAPFTSRPNLTVEEKTRLARRFRRRAKLAGICILLTVALAVAGGWLDSAAVSVLFLCAAAAAAILSAHLLPLSLLRKPHHQRLSGGGQESGLLRLAYV